MRTLQVETYQHSYKIHLTHVGHSPQRGKAIVEYMFIVDDDLLARGIIYPSPLYEPESPDTFEALTAFLVHEDDEMWQVQNTPAEFVSPEFAAWQARDAEDFEAAIDFSLHPEAK